jgi:hypothetical protein
MLNPAPVEAQQPSKRTSYTLRHHMYRKSVDMFHNRPEEYDTATSL